MAKGSNAQAQSLRQLIVKSALLLATFAPYLFIASGQSTAPEIVYLGFPKQINAEATGSKRGASAS